jgi:CopG family nickel-responsive transcriptional regulator
MVVFSISMGSKGLKDFDDTWKALGYASRSDAIRDAVHKFAAQNKWTKITSESEHFLISIVYDSRKKHHVHEVMHDFADVIHSSMHTHFNNTCVEQLVLRGDTGRVHEMLGHLASLKEVRVCNCIV